LRRGRIFLHVPVCVLIGTVILGPRLHGDAASGQAVNQASSVQKRELARLDDWVLDLAAESANEAVFVKAYEAEPTLSNESATSGFAAASGGPNPPVPLSYTVQPGDSLGTVAERFGVDIPTLLGSNELHDPDLLAAGAQLKVLPMPGVLYRVTEDDTLNQIAARYGVGVDDILRANLIENSDLIAPGQELILPGAKPVIRSAPRVSGEPTVELDPIDEAVAGVESSEAGLPQPHLQGALLDDEPSLSVSRPTLIWPTRGPITTYFGQVGRSSPRGHAGLDIAAPTGTPVVAAAAGQIAVAASTSGGYGIQIILDHGGGLRTVYAHLSRLNAATGDQVKRGQLIGLVGSTGFSTGPHLHFEVRQNSQLRDPLQYLPKS
jgi:murein DD-endopeptidase MepM/ murein hydrolase activator NlpD